MALIIKGDMPKACITGKLPNYEYCVCFGTCHHANSGSERPSDCPLVEIPDNHGRLKDESVIIENMGNAFDKLFPLDGKHKQTIVSDCHVEFMRAVFNAPVVVEASK